MSLRIFHTAGPGKIIDAHGYWKRKEHYPNEVTITFSSQFQDFCQDIGAEAYIIGHHHEPGLLRDGPFTIEQRPKPFPGASGVMYHLSQIVYGLGLLVTAVRFRANLAVLDSGSTYYFLTVLFRLMGIRIIPVLHNTVWAHGYPPTRPIPRFICWLDSFFYRYVASAVVGVSPECVHQVEQLTGGRSAPLYEIRAQFLRERFEPIKPPPPFEQRPFEIMFIGRVTFVKGVLDILEMAQKIEAKAPGQVRWDICGSGTELDEMKRRCHAMQLESIVNIRGWTPLDDLIEVYSKSHASIVPTRSAMLEGMAMTAAEAIMAGRPLITNPVVPALEVLRPACVAGRTDDVDSYVDVILELISSKDHYERLRQACPALAEQFFDREQGLTAVLKRIVQSMALPGKTPAIDRLPS